MSGQVCVCLTGLGQILVALAALGEYLQIFTILRVGASDEQAQHTRRIAHRIGGVGLIVVEVRCEAENIAGL